MSAAANHINVGQLADHLRARLLDSARADLERLGPDAALLATEVLADAATLGARALAGEDVSGEMVHVEAAALGLEAAAASVAAKAVRAVVGEAATILGKIAGGIVAGALRV